MAPSCVVWWVGRFVGAEATAALDQLYAAVRLYGNLF